MITKHSRIWIFSILVIACSVTTAPAEVTAPTPLNVVTTTGMIADISQNIAGDTASVRALMGVGVDPHLYKPTRSDISLLTSADIVLYNGLLLEGKMSDTLIRIATSGKKVFAVTDLLEPNFLLEPTDFAGHYDPHVWMDISAWMQAIEVVNAKFGEALPNHKETLANNTKTYLKELSELDKYATKSLSSIPEKSRILITAHDAFNYFGRRYKLEVIGIQGLSTESEAGVKDIERIVNLLVDRKIGAVFVESTVPDKNVRALIEGASAKGHKVIIGGELFSDAMGKQGTYEGTYIGMMDHNVTTIARALGGVAPTTGFQGKLSQQHRRQ